MEDPVTGPMKQQPLEGNRERQPMPMGLPSSKRVKKKTRSAQRNVSPIEAEIARKRSLQQQRRLLKATRRNDVKP